MKRNKMISYLLKMYSVFMALLFAAIYLGTMCVVAGFFIVSLMIFPKWLSLSVGWYTAYVVFFICLVSPAMFSYTPYLLKWNRFVADSFEPEIARGFPED